ncbi:hypothetical protein RN346_06125 [Halomonas sp. PAMB 3232]|uniref:hypothetical protein n=1 Tax=Halomonas sp. PAMB 3232 TaxID=3075221 RepID=UPI0028997507|nr:hypothetical protein [Halomonas sp. PAMB 3232]WNL40138.1 hypothetical protein RN346_06125 [Halomonas sp. PAMB 3232]
MPLQNRIDPYGQLCSVSARGALMGNRGLLHDDDKAIKRPWAHKQWVTCVTHFPGHERPVFEPGRYSQLFFLDEATAFAAGHRPCGSCRQQRFKAFKHAWLAANPRAGIEKPSLADIDKTLHAERARRGGHKVTFQAALEGLPFGTLIDLGGQAYLVTQNHLLPWSFEGYGPATPLPASGTQVTVLTPASIVELFRSGFRPQVHESAEDQR